MQPVPMSDAARSDAARPARRRAPESGHGTAAHAPTRPLTRHDVLHPHEVAQLLGVAASTVYYWARQGTIPGHKRGRRWLFVRWEIEEWLVQEAA
jgi:excisionase family DNA binding protein